ncbi:SpoIIE family protein phosphatase [Streptomyces europaeiscabiei]|uniref:SpoIIE family protein phosphatase n=1 Tax=Streptomyces europaeiscabiei TaxID=146819 RepID=UPI00099D2F78|nr:SpoIIE family protein phosphatase [Streptomyces europaeiscabiei]MDX2762426.1 SpoIIE family protein phosphatase [Streptomyces europaeiscabiei]MDX2772213.1 SpoIIE family protein phosphatase [Streptomyces europaeiscabiei]MDX3670330.1 SpoIIE family protein phosphatase [Streptomyces europaeiscabiei]MDX3837596.1 SpoIIE family protein phosphatase [Streptomyces europaeiscabiei]MDX3846553.1 SpoIIE family protein phosphatase [Streptomyces europaeiscabiei]
MTGSGEEPGVVDPLGETLAAAVRRTGARSGGVYLLDPAEAVLGLVALCGVPVDAFAPWWRAPYSVHGPSQDAIRNDRLVWVSSLDELARCYPRVAASIPYQVAFAVVPLRAVRHCRGALLLMWSPGRSPCLSRRERGRIVSSARRIARVLDAATLPPVIPDRPRFVRPHHAEPRPQSGLAAAELVERLPLGTLALDLGGCVTYVNAAAAGLLGRPAEQLLGTQPWQSLTWLDNIAYMDAYRTAMSSREPLALTVLRPPDQWLDLRLHADDSGTSVLIAPAPSSKPLGAQPAFTGAPSHSRIHLLMALAAALTETLGVQDVVDLVAERILPAFGAHGMIMSTADAGRIQIIGHRGYDPAVIERFDGLPTDADLTPAGRALTTGASSFFADRGELSRLYPRAPQITDKHAWAFLPLLSSGHPIGCLLLAYNDPHPFTAAERSILTPLAGLIAQALDRARLYDAQHNLAHALQQTLLPHALPAVTGLDVAARYLPASHGMDIGGDFYDLVRLTDTTAAAVIGDVQGHDMTAAALMGQVRMAVHSHATAGAAPDQVLARTDRDLADLNASRFVSCLYAHLDLARHQVTLASAGHPPPLVRHPGNRTHPVDIRPGPPLGIGVGTPSYPLTTLSLAPETLLALYTDGLVENPGTDIAQNITGLAHHLGEAGDLPLHQLVDSLVRHTRRTGLHTDDIALLLLRPTAPLSHEPTGSGAPAPHIWSSGQT